MPAGSYAGSKAATNRGVADFSRSRFRRCAEINCGAGNRVQVVQARWLCRILRPSMLTPEHAFEPPFRPLRYELFLPIRFVRKDVPGVVASEVIKFRSYQSLRRQVQPA